jgi:NADH-ubiquinone oxidoreductase chain 5
MSELIVEWELVKIIRIKLECVIIFDFISIFFLALVMTVSIRVYIFRVSYMSRELFIGRFFFILTMFVVSILFLILSPNLISILLGWDGLGVTSYLLVIFYQRRKSYNAGIITALTNRIGDVGILICVSLMAVHGD